MAVKRKKRVKAPERTLVQQEILKALEVKIERAPLSMGYRITLSILGVAMLLLPLIYLGLIGLIAHTIWWNWAHADAAPVKDGWFFTIVIGFVGTTTIFFMIKPIFTGWGRQEEPVKPDAARTMGSPGEMGRLALG